MLLYLELAGIAIFLASIPIYFFIKKNSQGNISIEKKLMYFTLLIIFFTFDLILFGAFTRLTDSGLGCPDWPGCFNNSNPFNANYHIDLAQKILPNGPVTIFKAWVEMIHRYFASMVGLLIIVLNILTYKYKKYIKFNVFYTLPILLMVIIQGLFGALTVSMKLQPIIVTIHLTLAMILIVCLTALYTYQKKNYIGIDELYYNSLTLNLNPYYYKLCILAFIAVLIQIILGAWVSSNYAMLGCTDFPSCINKQYFPSTDFYHGFSLWRSLGKNGNGDNLSFEALTAIHLTHRIMALIVFSLSISILYYLYRRLNAHKINSSLKFLQSLQKIIIFLVLILCLQVSSGIASVLFSYRIIIVLIHTAGAALLLCGLTYLIIMLKPQKNNIK